MSSGRLLRSSFNHLFLFQRRMNAQHVYHVLNGNLLCRGKHWLNGERVIAVVALRNIFNHSLVAECVPFGIQFLGIRVGEPEVEFLTGVRVEPSAFDCIVYNVRASHEVFRVVQVYAGYSVVVRNCHDLVVWNSLSNPVAALYHSHNPALVRVCHGISPSAPGISVLLYSFTDNLYGIPGAGGVFCNVHSQIVKNASVCQIFLVFPGVASV